jgi:hypothetical protein
MSKFDNKCATCGFEDSRALQIDHVNGGGSADRKLYRVNAATYYKRVLADTDNEFQILCANCNWIKRYDNKEDIKKEKI